MCRPRKLYFVLLALALSLSVRSDAGRKLRVLFIGNSYTYVNNLPQLTASVAASMGDTLIFDSYAPGGYRFADHVFDPACGQKIRSAKWDYVILQEQSQMPSMQDGTFFTNSYHYAYVLDTMIQNNDPCTQTMFYMTWGRKNGDSVFCNAYPSWPAFCTYEGLDSLINLRYRSYADTALPPMMGYPLVPGSWFSPIRLSQVSPVGAVRHYIRDQYPSIELYQADESHPSEAGTYAGACTFYTALFRKDPSLISYNYILSSAEADNIKQAAKKVVFDSLNKWYLGLRELRAEFTASASGGNLVIFLNTSTPITASFQWDFGDGTTSAGATNLHTYAAPGTYEVRLIATDGSCSDTAYAIVSTSSTGVSNLSGQDQQLTVSPNPASQVLDVHAPANGIYGISIINASGQVVYHRKNIASKDLRISIADYSSGIYTIIYSGNDGQRFYAKFAKL
jgi:PKD repeat protein